MIKREEKTIINYYGIQAWGVFMESSIWFIADEVKKAQEKNAPENAIYEKEEGGWVTVNDIVTPEVKLQIETSIAQIKQAAEKSGWNE